MIQYTKHLNSLHQNVFYVIIQFDYNENCRDIFLIIMLIRSRTQIRSQKGKRLLGRAFLCLLISLVEVKSLSLSVQNALFINSYII